MAGSSRYKHGLIETWDVLKSRLQIRQKENDIGFNRNMGCIEMCETGGI